MLAGALGACRGGLGAVVVFSLFANVLMLTLPLYMWQVFDRVIVSRSVETLLYLTLIAVAAIAAGSLIEAARSHIMVRFSTWLEQRLGGSLLAESIAAAYRRGLPPSVQALRDLSTFRTFLAGPSVFPIMDAPWLPIYVGILFLLHPALGFLGLGGGVVLFAMAVLSELATRKPLQRANAAQIAALSTAEAAARNADTIMAMGMLGDLVARWRRSNAETMDLQARASIRAGHIAAASRFLRFFLQMAALGLGAWLVLQNAISAGAMIAGSILLSRALAPVEQAIASWRSAITAHLAYRRLKSMAAEMRPEAATMPLPEPRGALRADDLTYQPAGRREPLFRNLSFRLEPGEAMGLIGPTAAGKTTLARLIVGNLAPRAGNVRLDGADVAHWDRGDLGRHIGYLPQDVELFRGTVRENIARMGEGDPATVIAAAQLAGVHDLILALPQGYETEIGEAGAALSGGQRQRVALARALYRGPRLVVLDEPNSNLDQAGEEALVRALVKLQEMKVTTVIVAHRPSILRRVDKILMIRSDGAWRFAPRDEILAELAAAAREQAASAAGGRGHG